MKMRRYALVVGLFLGVCSSLAMGEKITIKGLGVHYNEVTQEMVTSGNAELVHPDFKILADIISYNKDTGNIIGEHNIELVQGNQVIISEYFHYNTTTGVIKINDVSFELTTKIKHQQVFSRAESFEDHSSYKIGKNGYLTTCDYDPPHYYIHAESFSIYPKKRVIGQNVRLVNPVLFIPLGFWSPAYVFDLGKRKVIYLMPVIGTNTIEGGFFKSQVDYVLNDHWTGQAYMDYLSKKGIGLGTRLNYNNYTNLEGDIYYYGVSGTQNNVKEWNQVVQISDTTTLKTHIQSKNMYLIQGGDVKSDAHLIQLKQKKINADERVTYSFNQTELIHLTPQTYQFDYVKTQDDNHSASVAYKRSKNSVISDAINLKNSQKIGYDITNKNHVSYYQKELSAVDKRKDSYLKSTHELTKKIESIGHIRTAFDVYFDTDEDTVTSDIQNHIVQKLPEIDMSFNTHKINDEWGLNQSVQYGYYMEQYYISSLEKQRDYAQSRFILDQALNGAYAYDFLNGKLQLNTSYKQYHYFSGDQTFTLNNTSQYTTDSFSFLKTNTAHHRTWVPKNGNTPFYFDERDMRDTNELKETITLYYLSDTKYALKYSSGYNWVVDYQLDNEYELLIRPNRTFKSVFRTTYLLQQHRYSPLVSRFDITPSPMFSTSIQANYDLNDGEMINLNHVISGATSKTWENRWIFDAYFT
ncbi:MAG: hypothetical protein ACO3K7_03350, partial [Candidatus Marinamargulisbacteria bacterium]